MNIKDYTPAVLPPYWSEMVLKPDVLSMVYGSDQSLVRFFVNNESSLSAALSIDDFNDNAGAWLHLSVSKRGGSELPSWRELKEAKELFLGDRIAVQMFPPKDSYVNISETLHLFHRLDGDTVAPGLWRRM